MKKVLVVGDAILDVYRECSFKKECPDAPGVRAVVEHTIDVRAGGAANVAVNLAALAPNVQVDLVSILSSRLAQEIKRVSAGRVRLVSSLPVDECLTKERVLVDGSMAIRVDNFAHFDDYHSGHLHDYLEAHLRCERPDLILLSDYGAGSVGRKSLDLLLEHRDRLLVDTKMHDLSTFGSRGSRTLLVKLNGEEWRQALSTHHSPEQFFEYMVVTKGENGAELITQRPGMNSNVTVRRTFSVSAHDVPALDVCGCGDTFLAGLAAALLSGKDAFDSMRFANAAAAAVVSTSRTAVADLGATLQMLGGGV